MVNPYILILKRTQGRGEHIMAPEKRHFTGNLGSIYKLSMGLGRHRVGIESTYSRHTVGIQSAYSYNGVANIPKYLLVLFLAGSHSSKVKEEDGRVKDL